MIQCLHLPRHGQNDPPPPPFPPPMVIKASPHPLQRLSRQSAAPRLPPSSYPSLQAAAMDVKTVDFKPFQDQKPGT